MHEYQPFQKVEVVVIEKLNMPSMYWVRIVDTELEGQLVCIESLNIGEQVVCQYGDSDDQGRIVFCVEFAERQRLVFALVGSSPERRILHPRPVLTRPIASFRMYHHTT